MVNIEGNLKWFDKVSNVTQPSFHLDINLQQIMNYKLLKITIIS